ncbi:MAG: 3-deoxy-manno-octulosonate cytidylyltransferase [Candidatus Omnitrophica bacterium]|nr:3-deoxy-manno-octulosonate cytidylyltransferase [Candidatus Omnitrophota bacterium]
MSGVRVAAIIPARMASSRFPGKPLLEVAGLPMVEHVRRRVLRCQRFHEVVVATCDAEIAEAVAAYGGKCLMTSPAHPAATDRVSEAMRQVDCTHVVNVQGDEILVLPDDLETMARAMEVEPSVPAWNAVARIETVAELADASIVKCVVSVSGRILFCSRNLLHLAGGLAADFGPVRKVLGILGYRRDFLERYGELARTPLERAESIDQSRVIEHDVMLRAVEFSKGYPGINEPREVELVDAYLHEDALQQAVLREILS